MNPAVTIVLPSHLKPEIVDAIACLRDQTLADWNCVIYDAGHWQADPASPMHDIYARYKRFDPRIEWIITNDPLDFRDKYCPCSYRFNQAVREGKVTGDYAILMPDDDLIAPTYLERMTKELDKGYGAVYCAQQRVTVGPDGTETPRDVLRADHHLVGDVIGSVDLLQVMFRVSLLEQLEPPYMPEDPQDSVCRLQDGIFFNKLLTVTHAIYPVPEVLCTHRFTPRSTYTPSC